MTPPALPAHRTRVTVAGAVATVLAATTLSGTFTSAQFLPPVAVAVAVVAAVGVLGRRWRWPALAVAAAQVGAAAFYIGFVFSPGTRVAGIFPGSRTVTVLRALVAAGRHDIVALAAPVETERGLVLLTVAGLAAVAIAVDTLAAGARRPALAGLPLLAVVAVPAAVVPEGVGWLSFALAAAGYLGLLLADGQDRTARWGPTIGWRTNAATAAYGDGSAGAAAPAPLTAGGPTPAGRLSGRIGVAAVAMAVVVPALVPGMHGRLVGTGNGTGGAGSGPLAATTYNPITDLKGQLLESKARDLLKVTTIDPTPGYLRMTALDRFSDDTWSASPLVAPPAQRVGNGLPAPPGLAPGTTVSTATATVTVSDLSVPWLPLGYPARKVTVSGDWRYDERSRTVFSTHADTRDLTYRVTTTRPVPTVGQLGTDEPLDPALDPYLQLPADLPRLVTSTVRRVTAGATSRYEKAVALQAYFRSPQFSYDLQVPQGNGEDALVAFLQNKRGFCEQFAAAMAVMARVAGIPARVAIGFTAGRQLNRDTWLVTTHDAHSWPELFFPGVGWLQFEPTPTSDGRAVTPAYSVPAAAAAPDDGTRAAAGAAPAPAGESPLRGPRPDGAGANAGSESGSLPNDGGGRRRGLAGGGAVVAMALLTTPWLSRRLVRRRRWAAASSPVEQAHAAWAELLDDAVDAGRPVPVSRSPRATATLLVEQVHSAPARAALRAVADAEERARYAPSMAGVGDLRAAVATIRRELFDPGDDAARRLAVLLPRSVIRRSGSLAASMVADILDRLDGLAGLLRRRLPRPRRS